MSKKEIKEQKDTKNLVFYALTALIILVSFFLFVPKISSALFPLKRQMLWNNFLTQVQKEQKINPQAYWEFREFYSPGYFTQDKTANSDKVSTELKAYGIPASTTFSTLLSFQANNSESIDTLTTMTKFDAIISPLSLTNVLFKNNHSLIYKPDENHVIIIFLKPLNEMKTANGFFDYNEKDKKLVEGKNWLSILKITLP